MALRRMIHGWPARPAVMLAGMAVCLLALEGGLRCLGVWHAHVWQRGTVPAPGGVRILCAGDSFTVGMGAPSGESYPAHLQRMLDACATGKYVVINAGVASQNTAQLRNQLPAQLEAVRPAAVVVLCGCANQWNKWGHRESAHAATAWLTRCLYRIRVWKLIQRLWRDVRDMRQNKNLADAAVLEAAEYQRVMAAWHEQPCSHTAYEIGMFFARERNVEAACSWLQQAVELEPSDREAQLRLAGVLLEAGRRAEAHTVLTNAVACEPADARLWHRLGLLHSHNAQHSAALHAWLAGWSNAPGYAPTLEALVAMQEIFPEYKEQISNVLARHPATETFRDADPIVYQDREFVSNETRDEAADWACHDLSAAVDLCRDKGSTVFLLTYPLRYTTKKENTASAMQNYYNRLHRLLADVAHRNGAQLIDVRSVFDAHHARKSVLLEPEGIGDHCTSKGYALMARQVFAGLCAAGIVTETNAAPVRDAWLATQITGTWHFATAHTEQTTLFTADGGWSATAIYRDGMTVHVQHASGSWLVENGVLCQYFTEGGAPAERCQETIIHELTPSTLTFRVRGAANNYIAQRKP